MRRSPNLLLLSLLTLLLVVAGSAGVLALFTAAAPTAPANLVAGTLVIDAVPPEGQVYASDLKVGNLAPGDAGWGTVPIVNQGSLDAWVWFESYSIDPSPTSIFRNAPGTPGSDKLTLDHQGKRKLIPAGQTRSFDVNYTYPKTVANGHQGRTGQATLLFKAVQVAHNAAAGWTQTSFGSASTQFTTLPGHGGVVKFNVPTGNTGAAISQTGYTDAPLSTLSSLTFQTYVESANTVIPWVELLVDTNGDQVLEAVLQYRPADNGAVTPGVWQTWTAHSGNWRIMPPGAKDANNIAPGSGTLTTLAGYVAANPNARLVYDGGPGGFRFVGGKDGTVWNGLVMYLDNVTVTVDGSTDSYDFD